MSFCIKLKNMCGNFINNGVIPVLYVVGAGPGDPELITMKGYRILQDAKVVLYDNLACKDLLNLTSEACEKIYVGKKPYGTYTSQETIHQMIKHYAYTKGNVVRLKGGDPFIFGRGFEEVLFARSNGIEVHYIPGISSMQTSGLNNIPLTHRGVSESIWIITGTKKDGSLSSDLQLAIQSKATVVIYMGMKKLAEIAATYTANGKGDMPAAIIQHATLPKQKQVFCNAENLFEAAQGSGLGHPAIILIGNVVKAAELAVLPMSDQKLVMLS
jgi:uroporphyrin-III C-methyltransferase